MDILEYRLKALAQAVDARFDRAEAAVVPAGGLAGDILTKTSSLDYELAWAPGIAVSPTPPPDPRLNQLWVDTSGA